MKAELIDSMGSDLTVVNAARVSFDKESFWTPESEEAWLEFDAELKLKDQDVRLINFLARNNHWTPFGHCSITLRETVPIFVARQRFKHTVGFVYNEISRRYVDDVPEFYIPKEWRGRAADKKQGSEGVFGEVKSTYFEVKDWDVNSLSYNEFIIFCNDFYMSMIADGVAPEQARMVLPQSMYTSYYVTGSLAAFARAYKLRSDEHAQQEIQELAAQWNAIIRPMYPVSWNALCSGSTNYDTGTATA